jgi:hypothetical protein
VNRVIQHLCYCLFEWIFSLAAQNDKYSDVVKMHNFGFIERALHGMSVDCLRKFLETAESERRQAEVRYVVWMINYSLPSVAALAKRIEGVGDRVRQDELELYVRRLGKFKA